jgi:molybdopterin molybdotransferase
VELEIFKPVTPGKNVSFKGEDVKKGEEVVKEGRLLGANEIGMLAAIGKSRVKVYKKLKIGIISTGDELLDPKLQSLAVLKWEQKQNKVADVNSYVLAGLIQKIAHPWRIGIVKDDYDEIKRVIATSLQECDGLLISGGSSVGERDFLADVVEDLGELMFHGVSIRPGEPTGFAVIENKPVFILPGYPVATISAFELLVRPFLYALHGLREEVGIKIFAVAKRKIPSAVGRSDFVRVKVELIHDNYYVEPVRISGSGILSSMTKSDGFVVVEENKEGVQEGERVEVNMYHLK